MPNIKSAKKRVLVTLSKTNTSKAQNTALKTAIKKAHTAVTANAADKDAVVKAAMKKVDQSVTKGLIHKNNGARKKAALAKLIKEG